jgi:hypothetical protein
LLFIPIALKMNQIIDPIAKIENQPPILIDYATQTLASFLAFGQLTVVVLSRAAGPPWNSSRFTVNVGQQPHNAGPQSGDPAT